MNQPTETLKNQKENEDTDFIHLRKEHIREYPNLVFSESDSCIERSSDDTARHVLEKQRSNADVRSTDNGQILTTKYRPIYARAMVEEEYRELEEKKRKYKNVQCVNCGEKGHVVKDCTAPITSFGIIAFKTVNDNTNDKNPKLANILHKLTGSPKLLGSPKFLMIQRKDTMGYIDFVRGKYPENDNIAKEKLINVCLNEMTAEEKNNLTSKKFDTIWDELWVNHESKCYKNEKPLAKIKFERLDIKSLVSQSETRFDFQEFSFPKGRKNMRENNISCAEREFYEETGYRKEHYNFIKNYPTIHEEFMGTNGVAYRHIYYLVKMKDNIPPPRIDKNNILQTGEVQNIGWFTFEECMALIRPYDTAKKTAIENVYKDILGMKDNYECSPYYHRGKTSNWNNNNRYDDDYRSFVFKSRSL